MNSFLMISLCAVCCFPLVADAEALDGAAGVASGRIFPEHRPQEKRLMSDLRVAEGLSLEDGKQRRRFALQLLTTAVDHLADGLNAEGEARQAEFLAAQKLLDALLGSGNPEAVVSAEGGGDPTNLRLSEIAWGSALRYRLKGEEEDFFRARRLLLEFAREMPGWPVQLSNKRDRGVPQDSPRLSGSHDSGGLWWRWYPLDLMEGTPLLYAYALIEPRLTGEERAKIHAGVFDTQLSLLKHWRKGFHNTLVYLIEGYVSYGLALERPDLIHSAVGMIRDLIPVGYSPDGFWHEGSPAYHRQVEMKLRGVFRRLEGYSDPLGWKHPTTGKRFDKLSLQSEFAEHLAVTDAAWEKLVMPDGFLAAVNDTDPDTYEGTPPEHATPALLGTSGYAILGSGGKGNQSQLFLNYKGTFGHEHLDVNGIHWYALGRRWFDETRYRPIPKSGSERSWSASTAAHNTVVIDEQSQPNRFGGPYVETFGKVAAPYDEWPLRRAHAGSNHMGDLLLFDGENAAVQVMEVEGKKAYPGVASLYRRTLVKVDLGAGEGYLVDIFRVKGGKCHDYMLHGALAEPYSFSTTLPLQPLTGRLHRYIDLSKGGIVSAPFEFSFTYGDGAVARAMVLTPGAGRLLVGKAPAINRKGHADWVNLRHEAGESTFVVVHEARRGTPGIASARLLSAPGAEGVIVEVKLGKRVDTILSTLSAEGRAVASKSEGVEMVGRLGYVRQNEGGIEEAFLWDGLELSVGSEVVVKSAHAGWSGEVLAAGEAIEVKGGGESAALRVGATLHVDLGGLATWSYRIRQVVEGDVLTIIPEYSPGFVIHKGGGEMTRHPGWSFSGEVRARVPGVSHYKASAHQTTKEP